MITLTINNTTVTRDLPEVYRVSSGPMSMHSALIGTVSRMLEHLCSELAKQPQPKINGLGFGMSEANGDNLDCLVRLWVVVEEDRGAGATVCSCHVTEEAANNERSGHKFVEWVDIPWSRLETLRPNGQS